MQPVQQQQMCDQLILSEPRTELWCEVQNAREPCTVQLHQRLDRAKRDALRNTVWQSLQLRQAAFHLRDALARLSLVEQHGISRTRRVLASGVVRAPDRRPGTCAPRMAGRDRSC